jgi:UPF0716 protein FxsA
MPILVLLFILVPIAEIYLIIQIGQEIGALWTVILLIADSIIGARLLSWQGRSVWRAFQDALAAGRMPHREIIDGVMIVVGGAFLLTPGFITDVFGLLLLLPPTRALIRRAVVSSIRRRGAVTRIVFATWPGGGRHGSGRGPYTSPGRGHEDPGAGPLEPPAPGSEGTGAPDSQRQLPPA